MYRTSCTIYTGIGSVSFQNSNSNSVRAGGTGEVGVGVGYFLTWISSILACVNN